MRAAKSPKRRGENQGRSTAAASPNERASGERELYALGLPIAVRTARRMAVRFGGHIEACDLECVGMAALFDAVRSFDRARAEFEPYLVMHLRWAMLGEARLRARRANLLRRSAEMGTLPGWTGARSVAPMPLAALDPHLEEEPDDEPTGQRANPDAQAEARRVAELVRAALGALPALARELIIRHYYGGEDFDELGRELRLSRQATSRLHGNAQRRLRALLEPALAA